MVPFVFDAPAVLALPALMQGHTSPPYVCALPRRTLSAVPPSCFRILYPIRSVCGPPTRFGESHGDHRRSPREAAGQGGDLRQVTVRGELRRHPGRRSRPPDGSRCLPRVSTSRGERRQGSKLKIDGGGQGGEGWGGKHPRA